MTEDEAKTKWCPFVRERFEVQYLGQIAITALNRLEDEGCEGLSRCIASECMAWRATDNEYLPSNASNVNHPLDKGFPAGYCGLAK